MTETFNKATRNLDIFKYPWYKNEYPKIDQIVICKAIKIEDTGITFEILNYLSKQAFMPLNELSRKKVKSVRSIFKEGDIRPLLVLTVDDINGYIDLSNKYVDMVKDDITRLENYSTLVHIFYKWILYLENKDRKDFNQNITIDKWNEIFNSSLWEYKTNEIYEIMKKIRTRENTLREIFPKLSEDIYHKNDLIKLNKIIDDFIIIEVNISIRIKLICWAIEPILYIQNVCSLLSEKIKSYNLESNLSVSSPIYEFMIKSNELDFAEDFYDKIEDEFIPVLKQFKDISFLIQKNIKKIE